jgi:hypothetical protein
MRLLLSMAVKQRRVLKQGDCKNAFCQGILPPVEITIAKPPIGDPDSARLLKHTLYGYRCSPQHWYMKIKSVLHKMGLHQNEYDPCLFTGCIIDTLILADTPSTSPIALGLYVDDFVYFSADPTVEEKFQHILK